MSRIVPFRAPLATQRPDKRLATAIARGCLQGAIVACIEDDVGDELYVVTKSHVTRHLRTLDQVEDWLSRLEGRAGTGGQ